jgi:DNA-binding MarR family transcriptional regulator
MPFMKSIVDFDIVIEVGYAEEEGQPLTLKQLLLLNHSSRTTVRRRLAYLIEQGIVRRRKNANDRRSLLLTVSSPSLKLFDRYHGMLTSVFAPVPE